MPHINYHCFNNLTTKNKYPLLLISSSVMPLEDATIFTKLDICNAYHLVQIWDSDEWKTAFNTPLGHVEYRVMPLGLMNTPQFSRV